MVGHLPEIKLSSQSMNYILRKVCVPYSAVMQEEEKWNSPIQVLVEIAVAPIFHWGLLQFAVLLSASES